MERFDLFVPIKSSSTDWHRTVTMPKEEEDEDQELDRRDEEPRRPVPARAQAAQIIWVTGYRNIEASKAHIEPAAVTSIDRHPYNICEAPYQSKATKQYRNIIER